MKVEWLGQVRWEGERWQATGRFTEEPTDHDLRSKAWSVIGMRTKGSPNPSEVRKIRVEYVGYAPIPFREERP